MVKQVKARRIKAQRSPETKARELWLASLGAASLTRKQGIKLYGNMLDEGRALQSRVNDALANVGEQFTGTFETVRARIDGVVTPIRQRAEATFMVLRDEVEQRLQPVLVKFGVLKVKPRVTSKRVAKARGNKPVAKRAVRRAPKAA